MEETLSGSDKLLILRRKVHETKLVRIWKLLNSNNIDGILIKGWSVARFYDRQFERDSGDIDIVFKPEDYLKAKKVLKEHDLIDYHLGVRHLDTLDINQIFLNSKLIEIDGAKIRLLSAEDHLRVICVHWLTDGGERKERLKDIYYLVKNRPKDFDWNICLDVVSNKRQFWIKCVIAVASKYYKFQISDLEIFEDDFEVPPWIINELEKRWKEEPYIPLENVWRNSKSLFTQIKKRIPPNALMVLTYMEGDFESKIRIHYFIGYYLKKIFTTISRFLNLFCL